jgi:hypothetical protein
MTDPPENTDAETDEEPPETEASSIEERAKLLYTKGGEHLGARDVAEGLRVMGAYIDTYKPSKPMDLEALTAAVEALKVKVATPSPADLRENVASVHYTGSVWEVAVIEEGLSLNGRLYSREVLEKSLPIWEGQDVCVYGFEPGKQDHIPEAIERAFPEGTYLNKAGFLRNVTGRVNESGVYQVIAEFAVTNVALRSEMLETHNLGGRLPGFSIHAYGDAVPGTHQGRKCSIVTDLAGVRELTIVSKPAAGGRALRLVAAESTSTEENQMNLQKLRQLMASRQPGLAGFIAKLDDTNLLEAVQDSLKESPDQMIKFALALLAKGNTEDAISALEMALEGDAPAPAEEPAEEMPPALASIATESADVLALRNTIALDRCERILDKALTESALPEVAAAQIRAEFGGKQFAESTLAKSIADKRALLAVNAGGRAVVESAPRNPHISVMLESADKTQIGLNLMMGVDPDELFKSGNITESELRQYNDIKRHPNLLRPRRLYQEMSGDWGMTMNSRLSEAITQSSYSGALGTSINLVLAQAQRTRQTAGWENIVAQEDSDNLLDETNIIMGGYDILPDVSEGANYTDLGNPKEYSMTLSVGKKGGYVSITEEAIINDRIGAFTHLRDSARDAGFSSLDRLAWNLVTGTVGGTLNGDTSYDGIVHYHASHFNTASTAFSQAGLAAAHTQLANTRKVAFVTALDDATDVNTSDTTFVVDSTAGMQAGGYFRIDSEICRVTTVDSATQLTVVRAQQGTTAAAHLDNAVIVGFGGQLELGQSVAMGWGPEFYIIAPNELRSAVYEVLGSQYVAGAANFNANYFQGMYQDGLVKPIFVPSARLGGDSNNWFTAVPHQLSPMLKIRYFNGQRAPQVQDETPLSGDAFLADKMKFRVKFRFGGKALGHEGRTGNIVSGG